MSVWLGLVLWVVTSCALHDPDPVNEPETAEQSDQGMAMGQGLGQDSQFEIGMLDAQGVSLSTPSVKGIDVSYYQGTINWTSVKNAGYSFAFARVSDGTGTIDSKFAANWSGIKSAGMVRGVYQFFRPNQDAAAQANLLLSKIGTLGAGDLPPVIDVEVTGGVSGSTVVSQVKIWLDIVRKATGKTPIVYTAKYFWDALPNTSSLGPVTLWVANWGVSSPALPNLWSTWTFWQYSATGSVPGISGDVDMDYFNGDITALKTLAGQSTPPPVYTTDFQKPFTRILQYKSPNMTGSDVKLMQLMYNDWAQSVGLSAITADGIFGNGTKNAVITFQSRNAISATGVADAKVLNKMIQLFTARNTYYAPYTRTLKVTSPLTYGSDVTYLQNAYNYWAGLNGKAKITADGYYGNGTKTAVTTFQNTETVLLGAPDGIAGIHTQRLLFIRSYH